MNDMKFVWVYTMDAKHVVQPVGKKGKRTAVTYPSFEPLGPKEVRLPGPPPAAKATSLIKMIHDGAAESRGKKREVESG